MFLLQSIVFITLSVLRVFASKTTRYSDVDVILTCAQLLRLYNTIFAHLPVNLNSVRFKYSLTISVLFSCVLNNILKVKIVAPACALFTNNSFLLLLRNLSNDKY